VLGCGRRGRSEVRGEVGCGGEAMEIKCKSSAITTISDDKESQGRPLKIKMFK
jgi:hypothetical protein